MTVGGCSQMGVKNRTGLYCRMCVRAPELVGGSYMMCLAQGVAQSVEQESLYPL